jgi:hypothetical protein
MFVFLLFRKIPRKQMIFECVLNPLNEAYNILKQDEKMVHCNENTITKRLVWHLINDTSLSYLHLKDAVCVALRPRELYTIDEVYEPDIKITIKGIWIEIESKRIHEKNKWSVSEYLSKKNGIGKFLWGTYSRNDHGGMIGYIQNGDFHKIVQKIKTGLKKINCKKCENITKIENCVLSVHYRNNKEDIEIYHLFFYFS